MTCPPCHTRVLRPLAAACALVSVVVIAGCGADSPTVPPAAGADAPGAPSLLKRELARGEVLVEGSASPRSEGPFRFEGRYRVAFAQYAPEAPRRGFADEVPFEAELRSAEDPRARPVPLFSDAARGGARSVELDGRYLVEVLFGDFPFALRFTPVHRTR